MIDQQTLPLRTGPRALSVSVRWGTMGEGTVVVSAIRWAGTHWVRKSCADLKPMTEDELASVIDTMAQAAWRDCD